MKKIKFVLTKKEYEGWIEEPYPAVKNMPDWYKKIEMFHSNPQSFKDKSLNMTIKGCIPFRDFLTSGYFIPIPHDIDVVRDKENNSISLNWPIENISPIESHLEKQIHNMDIPQEFDKNFPMKWISPWSIQTPRGYSCMFISPQLRNSEIYSLPAIVDTDKYHLSVNIPFLLKSNFSGLIEKGTPIVQVIPFKRDSWLKESSEKNYEMDKMGNKLESYFLKGYKKMFWDRKIFK